jgi:tetratricopeptide (TPR) repeat protein
VDLGKTLTLAMLLHRTGKLVEAEALYQQILAIDPRHADAQHLLGVIAHQRGDHALAVSMIETALEWSPQSLQYCSNLAEALRALGRTDEAIAACRRALEQSPDAPELLHNLANTLCDQGRYEEAIGLYNRALQRKPELVPAQVHRANALRATGHHGAAITALRKIVQQQPAYVEALNSLGLALREQGQLAEAIERFEQVLQRKPLFAEGYSNLAIAQASAGRYEDAARSFQRAIELRPSLIAAHAGLAKTVAMIVPQWHIPMMNDAQRNAFYFDALSAVVTSDSHVVEIGTGSGLLAMMAATLGAKSVTTCESVPLIAATATQIIADNKLSERVRVMPMHSTKLDPTRDLLAPADVLIAEIFSSEFLGEGVLSSIEDAKRRLLKPGGTVVPGAGSIMVALFEGSEIALNLAVEQVSGFDLRRFNSIVSRKQFVSRNDLRVTLMSPPIEAFRFDFVRESYFAPQARTLETTVTKPGRCLGIIQWIRLELGENLVFENHPEAAVPTSSWQHCAYVLPTPTTVTEGQTATIVASHNRRVPWFAVEKFGA